MTQARNDVVRLRLTTLEKSDWAKAAGGARKLSEWIRKVCNEASEHDRVSKLGPPNAETASPLPAPGMTDLMISPEAIDEALLDADEEIVALAAKAKLEEARLPVSVPVIPNAKPKIVQDVIEQEASRNAQCPRWMHHRPGVYCGSCKQVIGR